MPADIVGSMIMETDDRGGKALRFQPGPIFANLVLADEINRATPKTQSALLEAMQERTVTSGTTTHELEAPFLVMATQNPIEMEGTYPLPEAQLDRFLMKILVTYPIARRTRAASWSAPSSAKKSNVQPVLDRDAILRTARGLPRGAGRAARAGLRHRPGDGHAAGTAGSARAGATSTSATAVRRAARRRWWNAAACWR